MRECHVSQLLISLGNEVVNMKSLQRQTSRLFLNEVNIKFVGLSRLYLNELKHGFFVLDEINLCANRTQCNFLLKNWSQIPLSIVINDLTDGHKKARRHTHANTCNLLFSVEI
jgi:hypothetical protein